ncbi:hypothetical protein MTBLM1_20353 [Rhodospirillaceae bacterium LM-1]|nr:hypothetical protein MTBLM1_20353 [Rhodospirillaceae bacterium LM-1]
MPVWLSIKPTRYNGLINAKLICNVLNPKITVLLSIRNDSPEQTNKRGAEHSTVIGPQTINGFRILFR